MQPVVAASVTVERTPVNDVPQVGLNNGVTIPQLGFGTWQVPPDAAAEVVGEALRAGYRHVDTAQMYGNEAGVGRAVRESGLARDEVFVTSKLNNNAHARDAALRAFDRTMAELGLDVLDLFLVHWPLPTVGDYVDTWRTMGEILASGRVRAVGVSNFTPEHLDRVVAETGLVPAVNQIEVHPYFRQDVLRAHGARLGVVTEAWSPLAQGQVAADPAVLAVAARLGRTPAQVVLRWHVQRGDVVFPKSTSPVRMRENLDVFSFELDGDATAALDALDRDGRIGPDPDVFDWVPA